ncbi:hypothetical protein ACFQDE_09985 [Deinococcus caeni]|uniref:hypothetical protein n=1 Tax=Deinococcus caeni TaxID=569127 RepID=UPI00361B0CD1
MTAALNAGAAEYASTERPPPPAWEWLRAHGPADSYAAWAAGASAAGIPLSGTQAGTLALRGWADTVQVPAPPLPCRNPPPPPPTPTGPTGCPKRPSGGYTGAAPPAAPPPWPPASDGCCGRDAACWSSPPTPPRCAAAGST